MKISEIQHAQDSEYEEITKSQFSSDRAPLFHELTNMSNQNFIDAYPDVELQTMKSDSGNFLVQWFENNDIIAIVGIITKEGKILRKDYGDVLVFFDMLLDRLRQGKRMMTSPNLKSMKLVNKIDQIAKERGMNLNIEKSFVGNVVGGDHNDPELNFYQVVVTA